MYKVLFFNGNSCTGFSMDFNNNKNAREAIDLFLRMHGNNVAVPFDDSPSLGKESKKKHPMAGPL